MLQVSCGILPEAAIQLLVPRIVAVHESQPFSISINREENANDL